MCRTQKRPSPMSVERTHRRRGLSAALLVALTLSAPAAVAAAPEPLVLPLTGLVVAPPDATTRHRVTSDWGFDDTASFYEARDVIDALDDSNSTTRTLWISVGWFAIGSCVDVLADAPIDDAWTLEKLSLWGARWTLRGGIYRGGGVHDGQGIVTTCVERGLRKQLVMSRFVPGELAPPTRSKLVAAVRADALMRNVYRAFHNDAVAPTAPARSSSVVDHGAVPARREVSLYWTGLTFMLPDDGFIWMTNGDTPGVDRLERMAPALSELVVSVVRLDLDLPCSEAFDDNAGAAWERPAGLPADWEPGPTVVEAQVRAVSACHRLPQGLLVVAVVSATTATDIAAVAPLLDALRDAGRQPPAPAGPSLAKREALLRVRPTSLLRAARAPRATFAFGRRR